MMPALSISAIAKELLDEVQAQVAEGRLDVELLRPPTLEALQQRLRDTKRPVHILHFDPRFDGVVCRSPGLYAYGQI